MIGRSNSSPTSSRSLALLLPIIPAIAWVLFNILQPALNQINRMSSKGVIVGTWVWWVGCFRILDACTRSMAAAILCCCTCNIMGALQYSSTCSQPDLVAQTLMVLPTPYAPFVTVINATTPRSWSITLLPWHRSS
ncbi:hypothetical protein LIER_06616 [Lithospermum erythrorhizon]|uniref:Uncharacterized protein n=1 Tax=Lithospermum erythrorhizon TaxID=34254 RepID=A0AAV3P559_LITER